jgi:60 kDa SS-A/Ro ribonucleoprotein
VVGFSAPSGGGHGGQWGGGDPGITTLPISPRQRLDDVVSTIEKIPMGGTDCSLPMRWAAENKYDVDSFFVYTDSETWAGPVHPHQALNAYRQKRGIAAKLGVVGLLSSDFTIADPSDAGMLDVVGFDSSAPAILADFSRGEA